MKSGQNPNVGGFQTITPSFNAYLGLVLISLEQVITVERNEFETLKLRLPSGAGENMILRKSFHGKVSQRVSSYSSY